jgi:hypothetical protein
MKITGIPGVKNIVMVFEADDIEKVNIYEPGDIEKVNNYK